MREEYFPGIDLNRESDEWESNGVTDGSGGADRMRASRMRQRVEDQWAEARS